MTRTASHDWLVFMDDGVILVQWCTLCGCVRTEDELGPHVYFPYAYEGISKTTCAKAREKRDAGRQQGRTVQPVEGAGTLPNVRKGPGSGDDPLSTMLDPPGEAEPEAP